MPHRLIISGSVTVGILATILAYNMAGSKGIWGLAAIIWIIVLISLIRLKKSPTPKDKDK